MSLVEYSNQPRKRGSPEGKSVPIGPNAAEKATHEVTLTIFRNRYSYCVLYDTCIKVAIHVRGGVLKFAHVVDNDTTLHDVHTHTVAFSPAVLIGCGICPHHQTLTRTP